MTLDCMIDDKQLSLSVNSTKPLLQILIEDVDNHTLNSSCHGKGCGNCVVLVNDHAALACLLPAFRLKGATITTFDSFKDTTNFQDIEQAYRMTGNRPCPDCFESKTLLIESILRELTAKRSGRVHSSPDEVAEAQKRQDKLVLKELSLNTCQCMDTGELLQIVEMALANRKRRTDAVR